MNYPIAEYFDSIQGEGLFCGERMFFLRLTGCPVGKYVSPRELQTRPSDYGDLPVLRSEFPEYSICESAFGQRFQCDTNYRKPALWLESDNLGQFVEDNAPGCQTICITGGEPFAHRLEELVSSATRACLNVHIETSGSVEIPPDFSSLAWITCSPKIGFLPQNRPLVHEWKFLLAANMGLTSKEAAAKILDIIGCTANDLVAQGQAISLQAIGSLKEVDQANVAFCLAVQRALPQEAEIYVRPQLHKFLGLR